LRKLISSQETLLSERTPYPGKTLELLARDNRAALYILWRASRAISQNATAWTRTLDGQLYAACTTTQFGYKPSINSTTLTVQPQSTQMNTVTKTPEEMQKQAEKDGLFKTWLAPGDSWCTWLKCYVRIHINCFNFTVQSWVGFPIGCGMEECSGLENIFAKIYEALPDDLISICQSAAINGITTAAVAFVTGGLATIAAAITSYPAYWVLMGIYSTVMTSIILGTYAATDKNTGKSILFGIGGTLIGFVIGLSSLYFVSNWWRSASMSYSQGSSLQIAAVKATINYFGSWGIKYAACVLGFASWINKEFNAATALLGLLALSLGGIKN